MLECSTRSPYTQHSPPARKGKIPRPISVAPSDQLGLPLGTSLPFNPERQRKRSQRPNRQPRGAIRITDLQNRIRFSLKSHFEPIEVPRLKRKLLEWSTRSPYTQQPMTTSVWEYTGGIKICLLLFELFPLVHLYELRVSCLPFLSLRCLPLFSLLLLFLLFATCCVPFRFRFRFVSFLACYERKSSAAAPFVYCITLWVTSRYHKSNGVILFCSPIERKGFKFRYIRSKRERKKLTTRSRWVLAKKPCICTYRHDTP